MSFLIDRGWFNKTYENVLTFNQKKLFKCYYIYIFFFNLESFLSHKGYIIIKFNYRIVLNNHHGCLLFQNLFLLENSTFLHYNQIY